MQASDLDLLSKHLRLWTSLVGEPASISNADLHSAETRHGLAWVCSKFHGHLSRLFLFGTTLCVVCRQLLVCP